MSPTSTSPVAVVAGGTAGVGRATVDALLDRGYRVAVMARGESRLDEMKTRLGDRVWTKAVDVSDGAAVTAAAHAIVADFGTPEVWVNSAMLTSFSPFDKVDEAEFRAITDTTYLGTVNGCRAALAVMARGNVVNVGSGLAYASVPNQAAYCGAKHAVEGFTQALRIEIARDHRPITLSMVQLPAINTPQFDWARNRMDEKPQPAPPIFQPEVAARAILRAIDTDAREMLVGSSVLQLMFGNMVLPDLVEHQLLKSGVEVQKSGRPAQGGEDNLGSPVEDYPTRSHGSYDGRASSNGIIVDGDLARKAVFFGGGAVLLVAGLAIGMLGGSSSSDKKSTGIGRSGRNRRLAAPRYLRPFDQRG